MNDWFSFEATPWELAMDRLQPGDKFSAVRLLTLLEGEEESALEDAFLALEDRGVALDISGLPQDFGSGETEKRLRMEQKLHRIAPESFPEGDPLRLYLEELARIPACGDVELLAADAAQGSDSARSMLGNLLLSSVLEEAKSYVGCGLLLMDLLQEGGMGMWQGILNWNGDGAFAEHARWWIRQYMARAVTAQARASGVGRKMRQALEDYRAADRRLLTELGRNPTVEEIAASMQVTAEDAQVYAEMLRNAQLVAQAKAPPKEPEEEDQAVEDTAYFQSRQRVNELLSGLTEQETQLVSLRFGLSGGLPATVEETAQKLGLTAEEVVSMEAAALKKLRNTNS